MRGLMDMVARWRERAGREGLRGQRTRPKQGWEVLDACADELEAALASSPVSAPALRDNGKPNYEHEFDEDPETTCCVICGWAEVVHNGPAGVAFSPVEAPDKHARDSEPRYSQYDMDAVTKPLHAEIERRRAEMTIALIVKLHEALERLPRVEPGSMTDDEREYCMGEWVNLFDAQVTIEHVVNQALASSPVEVCPETDQGLTPLPHDYRCTMCGQHTSRHVEAPATNLEAVAHELWVEDTSVLQAVLDAIKGTLDTSSQIADHPNVKFAQMERLKWVALNPEEPS